MRGHRHPQPLTGQEGRGGGGRVERCPELTQRRQVLSPLPASGLCLPCSWGIVQARISAIQIPYDIFVHNLLGVFQDLCRYTLGIASAHCFCPQQSLRTIRYIICSPIFKKWHRFCRPRICRFIFPPARNTPPPQVHNYDPMPVSRWYMRAQYLLVMAQHNTPQLVTAANTSHLRHHLRPPLPMPR